MASTGRDYRFIALTFMVGLLVGMWFVAFALEKSNWLLTSISIIIFTIWGFALFDYMKKEAKL